jgi:hypothetical protein
MTLSGNKPLSAIFNLKQSSCSVENINVKVGDELVKKVMNGEKLVGWFTKSEWESFVAHKQVVEANALDGTGLCLVEVADPDQRLIYRLSTKDNTFADLFDAKGFAKIRMPPETLRLDQVWIFSCG